MIPCWAEGSGFRLTQTPDGRQKRLDDLYEYGKKKGTLTYKEIMERLMDLYIEPDQAGQGAGESRSARRDRHQ